MPKTNTDSKTVVSSDSSSQEGSVNSKTSTNSKENNNRTYLKNEWRTNAAAYIKASAAINYSCDVDHNKLIGLQIAYNEDDEFKCKFDSIVRSCVLDLGKPLFETNPEKVNQVTRKKAVFRANLENLEFDIPEFLEKDN